MSNNPSVPRRTPVPGIYVAAITAVVSGVSVFVNSYGVKSVSSPLVYTTSKNIVATVILLTAWCWGARVGRRRHAPSLADLRAHHVTLSSRGGPTMTRLRRGLALAYVGVVGGGFAFVLFFNGLARSQPAAAAFWRDTLVPEVALFAVIFLRERIRWWNLLTLALLVSGEIMATGGVGHLAAQPGEIDVIASSGLWAIEVIVAKTLLRDMAPTSVATVRMGIGATTLLIYVGASGRSSALLALDARQLVWIVATGILLALYVATWMTALSRARALDVTSLLVGAAVITWALQGIAGSTSSNASLVGLALISAGTLLTLVANATKGSRRHLAMGPGT